MVRFVKAFVRKHGWAPFLLFLAVNGAVAGVAGLAPFMTMDLPDIGWIPALGLVLAIGAAATWMRANTMGDP